MRATMLTKAMIDDMKTVVPIVDPKGSQQIVNADDKIYIDNLYMLGDPSVEYYQLNGYSMAIDKYSHRNYWILPVLNYQEVKDRCKEKEDSSGVKTVEFGRGPITWDETSKYTSDINQLHLNYNSGAIVDTGNTYTYLIREDGTEEKTPIYRDSQTGEEFVIISSEKNINPSNISIEQIRKRQVQIHLIKPLEWKVSPQTGVMYCATPPFLSAEFPQNISVEHVEKYLQDGKFFQNIRVEGAKLEKPKTISTPFGEEEENVSTMESLRNLLATGTIMPCLVGPPGIGKSEIAESLYKYHYKIEMTNMTPDLFRGLTYKEQQTMQTTQDGKGGYITRPINDAVTKTSEPDWHVELTEVVKAARAAGERVLLILDEFDKLLPSMQVFINGIVSRKRNIAGWEIPDDVDIMACRNTKEHSDASFNISGEVASRMTDYYLEANVPEWLNKYARTKVDPLVRAYLYLNQSDFLTDPDKNGSRAMNPRSWTRQVSGNISWCRKARKDPFRELRERIMPADLYSKFKDFSDKYFSLQIEDILSGKVSSPDPLAKPEDIMTIINCLIATISNKQELKYAMQYVYQLQKPEYHNMFSKVYLDIYNGEEDGLVFRECDAEISRGGKRHGQ